MWALPGPHLGSSSPARRASSPTRRRRPPSRPWRRGSRRALRGIRPSGAVRLYADRAFLIPASRRPRSLASAALAERAETLAGIRRVLGSKPGLRFCRFGRGFAVISGYFWLFLAISGLGASPGGPGSKLIILRATGESQESALLGAYLGKNIGLAGYLPDVSQNPVYRRFSGQSAATFYKYIAKWCAMQAFQTHAGRYVPSMWQEEPRPPPPLQPAFPSAAAQRPICPSPSSAPQ